MSDTQLDRWIWNYTEISKLKLYIWESWVYGLCLKITRERMWKVKTREPRIECSGMLMWRDDRGLGSGSLEGLKDRHFLYTFIITPSSQIFKFYFLSYCCILVHGAVTIAPRIHQVQENASFISASQHFLVLCSVTSLLPSTRSFMLGLSESTFSYLCHSCHC